MCTCFARQLICALSSMGHLLQDVDYSAAKHPPRAAYCASGSDDAHPCESSKSATGEHTIMQMLQCASFGLASNISCHLTALHIRDLSSKLPNTACTFEELQYLLVLQGLPPTKNCWQELSKSTHYVLSCLKHTVKSFKCLARLLSPSCTSMQPAKTYW